MSCGRVSRHSRAATSKPPSPRTMPTPSGARRPTSRTLRPTRASTGSGVSWPPWPSPGRIGSSGPSNMQDFIECGPWVVVPWRARLHGRGSGLEIEVVETYAVLVRAGKIVRVEEYRTTEQALRGRPRVANGSNQGWTRPCCGLCHVAVTRFRATVLTSPSPGRSSQDGASRGGRIRLPDGLVLQRRDRSDSPGRSPRLVAVVRTPAPRTAARAAQRRRRGAPNPHQPLARPAARARRACPRGR